jgi:ribosomal protein S18 acetylase RimI-like enzyme
MQTTIYHTLLRACKLIQVQSQRRFSENIPLIRRAKDDDASDILELYRRVVSASPNMLGPYTHELTLSYVQSIVQQANRRGLALVVCTHTEVIGFVKAYTSEFCRFAQILQNATMLIKPSAQGQRYGTELLQTYLATLEKSFRHIRLFEIYVHASNTKAIYLYEKLGFVLRSSLPDRLRNTNGTFANMAVMDWKNEKFCEQALKQYHSFLWTLMSETQSTTSKSFNQRNV